MVITVPFRPFAQSFPTRNGQLAPHACNDGNSFHSPPLYTSQSYCVFRVRVPAVQTQPPAALCVRPYRFNYSALSSTARFSVQPSPFRSGVTIHCARFLCVRADSRVCTRAHISPYVYSVKSLNNMFVRQIFIAHIELIVPWDENVFKDKLIKKKKTNLRRIFLYVPLYTLDNFF